MATLRVCVVDSGALSEVEAVYRPAIGDTVVLLDGLQVPFASAFPDSLGYARSLPWFTDRSPLRYRWRGYPRIDSERVISPTQLKRVTIRDGVPILAPVDFSGLWPRVLYVPTRPGCFFQAYGDPD
jgi:hypothetical protein